MTAQPLEMRPSEANSPNLSDQYDQWSIWIKKNVWIKNHYRPRFEFLLIKLLVGVSTGFLFPTIALAILPGGLDLNNWIHSFRRRGVDWTAVDSWEGYQSHGVAKNHRWLDWPSKRTILEIPGYENRRIDGRTSSSNTPVVVRRPVFVRIFGPPGSKW